MKLGAVLAALVAVSCANCEKPAEVKSASDVVVENILTRRSIRDYKTEPVCREQMAKVIECGLYAPNAMNAQTWAVRVVDAPDFIDGVTAIAVEQMPRLAEQASEISSAMVLPLRLLRAPRRATVVSTTAVFYRRI